MFPVLSQCRECDHQHVKYKQSPPSFPCLPRAAVRIEPQPPRRAGKLAKSSHSLTIPHMGDRADVFYYYGSLEVRETQCSGFRTFVISHFNTILFNIFVTGRNETGRGNNEWHVGFPHSPAVCADHPQLSQSLSFK